MNKFELHMVFLYLKKPFKVSNDNIAHTLHKSFISTHDITFSALWDSPRIFKYLLASFLNNWTDYFAPFW